MEKYTFLTNISYVDFQGARLWCNGILIDNEGREGFGGNIRQIRGTFWGGSPCFTIWIDPEATVKFKKHEGGQMILVSDDGNHNMDGGVIVVVNEAELMLASPDDIRQPIEILKVENVPFGTEYDEYIFKYAGGKAYPRTVWTTLPERQ